MTVARKIEIARQIEEMKVLVEENKTLIPAKVRQRVLSTGLAEERLARQLGILATLQFCQQHESEFREFIQSKKGAPSQ
ncbi:MAG: hypothetical protein ACXWKQ_07345 [Reyranella sp.]